MTASGAEVVRRAAARLREARFARICQYAAESNGDRMSLGGGQVDFLTGMADLDLPIPGENGNVAMVVLRPPSGYLREPDGSWTFLGDGTLGVSSNDVSEAIRLLESETLVTTERGAAADARAFDVRVQGEDAQVHRAAVWISPDEYVVKLERLSRRERVAGVEFTAIGQPLTLISVPEVLRRGDSTRAASDRPPAG